MRGRGNKNPDKRLKPKNVLKVYISMSISPQLLQKIEENISGDSRSEKIEKCAETGFTQLVRK